MVDLMLILGFLFLFFFYLYLKLLFCSKLFENNSKRKAYRIVFLLLKIHVLCNECSFTINDSKSIQPKQIPPEKTTKSFCFCYWTGDTMKCRRSNILLNRTTEFPHLFIVILKFASFRSLLFKKKGNNNHKLISHTVRNR